MIPFSTYRGIYRVVTFHGRRVYLNQNHILNSKHPLNHFITFQSYFIDNIYYFLVTYSITTVACDRPFYKIYTVSHACMCIVYRSFCSFLQSNYASSGLSWIIPAHRNSQSWLILSKPRQNKDYFLILNINIELHNRFHKF